MKKYFCDRCGLEVSSLKTIDIPCHVYSKRGEYGYVDQNLNRVSGRYDTVELCSSCYNKTWEAAVKELKRYCDE